MCVHKGCCCVVSSSYTIFWWLWWEFWPVGQLRKWERMGLVLILLFARIHWRSCELDPGLMSLLYSWVRSLFPESLFSLYVQEFLCFSQVTGLQRPECPPLALWTLIKADSDVTFLIPAIRVFLFPHLAMLVSLFTSSKIMFFK